MNNHNFNRIVLFFLFNLGFIPVLFAQDEVIPVWSSTIPNSIDVSNNQYQEVIVNERVYKVSKPTLSVFFPAKEVATNTAVVICPGGGYKLLAIEKEGYKVAKWLNTLGITAVVLKYRLPNDSIMINKSIGPLQDAQEAIRIVRRNAKKWNLNEDKIGIMGFSAGGHLASTLTTHYNDTLYNLGDNLSAKPNFSLLIYPVISMNSEITHQGSKTNLLGESPSNELVTAFSNELQITAATPKTFLVHASDDGSVPVENSVLYYLALKANQVPAELHIYEKGGHGFGLGKENTSKNWTFDCENWLKLNILNENKL
jgi:acetyl esterase/lipase